jgi:hypothetical protein
MSPDNFVDEYHKISPVIKGTPIFKLTNDPFINNINSSPLTNDSYIRSVNNFNNSTKRMGSRAYP